MVYSRIHDLGSGPVHFPAGLESCLRQGKRFHDRRSGFRKSSIAEGDGRNPAIRLQ